MRLFLAFELDDAARSAVSGVARELAGRLAKAGEPRGVRWVERENLHVTLRFLGEVADSRAAALQDALSALIAAPRFEMELGGGGCFPPAGLPRVAWIGVTRGADGAREAFGAIDERLAPLGFPRETRSYTPHVTLGRVRDVGRRSARDLRAWLAAVPSPLASMAVRDAVLYLSHLSPGGSRYEIVCRTPLGS